MTVSLHIIADHLKTCEIVSVPEESPRRLSFLFLLGHGAADGEERLAELGASWDESLFVGSDAECLRLLESEPLSQVLCVQRSGDVSEGMRAFCERAMIVATDESPARIYASVQQCFAKVSRWVRGMQHVLLEGGGYQELVSLSEKVIGNPIIVSDVGFRIVAYTKGVLPNEEVVLDAIERGHFSKEAMDLFRHRGRPRTWQSYFGINVLDTPRPERPYHIINYVFRVQGHYFMHLVMHCSTMTLTEGLRDMLQLLIDHMELYLKRQAPTGAAFEQGAAKLLSNMALGGSVARAAMKEQLERAGIPLMGVHELYVFDYGYSEDEQQLPAYAAFRLMESMPDVLVFICGSHVVALRTDREGTVQRLSSTDPERVRRLEQLSAHAARYECCVGISDVFPAVDDIRYAYKQAVAAIEVGKRKLAVPTWELVDRPDAPVFRFHDCFADYLIASEVRDGDLVSYCARNSIVLRLAHDDIAQQSDDYHTLYVYLRMERRASAAADELHLHRTTLLYRIDKIEQRFGIDLNDYHTRERLLAEYSIMFLDSAGVYA